MKKFNRISSLNPTEQDTLSQLASVPGMSKHGNRIRTSTMLETDLALLLSIRSELDGVSVSNAIGDVIRQMYAPIISSLRMDGFEPELDAKTLLKSLSLHYGGFLTVSAVKESSLFSNWSQLPWGSSDPDVCPVILEESLQYLENCVSPNSLIGYLRSDDGFYIDFDLDDEMGFLCLTDPIDDWVLQIIRSKKIKII